MIVVKVWESLEKGYTNRRRCQAWILEKEAQSRPCPLLFPPSSSQRSGHMSKLCLLTLCKRAALWPPSASGCADWHWTWERSPGSWLGLFGQGMPRFQVGGGPKPGPLKHKLRARTVLPRSTCSAPRSKCLLGFIQHWLKERDTCLHEYSSSREAFGTVMRHYGLIGPHHAPASTSPQSMLIFGLMGHFHSCLIMRKYSKLQIEVFFH